MGVYGIKAMGGYRGSFRKGNCVMKAAEGGVVLGLGLKPLSLPLKPRDPYRGGLASAVESITTGKEAGNSRFGQLGFRV